MIIDTTTFIPRIKVAIVFVEPYNICVQAGRQVNNATQGLWRGFFTRANFAIMKKKYFSSAILRTFWLLTTPLFYYKITVFGVRFHRERKHEKVIGEEATEK